LHEAAHRVARRDVLAGRDFVAAVDMPTLIIWGEQDIAQGLPCLDGAQRYVRDLRIERLPGVSEWAQEDALQEVNRLLGRCELLSKPSLRVGRAGRSKK
jgi:pimeloyl-ACP methyl ester carboxylesterase